MRQIRKQLFLQELTLDSCISGLDAIKLKGIRDWSHNEKDDHPRSLKWRKIEPAELTPSEREEMILLRAENERLRAEIAIVKKRSPWEKRDAQRNSRRKAALVQKLREEGYKLKYLLDAIGLSRSTYYYERSKTDKVSERNADLSSEIIVIFNENKKRYGVRRVHKELLNRGFRVNHKRVQRIMNQLALFGNVPRKNTIPIKAMLVKLLIISSIEISIPKNLCKSGQPMYRSSICLGANVIFLRFWIWTAMK